MRPETPMGMGFTSDEAQTAPCRLPGYRRIPDLVGAEPALGQDCLPLVDDLYRRPELLGSNPDEQPRHELRSFPLSCDDAGRAVLARAGQSPREPHTGRAPGGTADRWRATPTSGGQPRKTATHRAPRPSPAGHRFSGIVDSRERPCHRFRSYCDTPIHQPGRCSMVPGGAKRS